MNTSNTLGSIARRIETVLPSLVDQKRLRHIVGVAETAVGLARRFGIDPTRARVAALAHDMDRSTPEEELRRYCELHGVELTAYERSVPVLLHGPVAAHRLEHAYGVTDAEIIFAVRHHTLGDGGFGAVGLVLFASDFLEPNRDAISERERQRILAGATLERIAVGVIEAARDRYGRLAEPTRRLYARLTEELGRESTP